MALVRYSASPIAAFNNFFKTKVDNDTEDTDLKKQTNKKTFIVFLPFCCIFPSNPAESDFTALPCGDDKYKMSSIQLDILSSGFTVFLTSTLFLSNVAIIII